MTWHCITLHYIILHYIALPYLVLPSLAFPCLPLPYLALPCLTLPYLALPCLTLPYLTVPCPAVPCCTALHYTTLYFPAINPMKPMAQCRCPKTDLIQTRPDDSVWVLGKTNVRRVPCSVSSILLSNIPMLHWVCWTTRIRSKHPNFELFTKMKKKLTCRHPTEMQCQ